MQENSKIHFYQVKKRRKHVVIYMSMNTTRNNAVTSLLHRAQVQYCVADAALIQSFHLGICIILGLDRI